MDIRILNLLKAENTKFYVNGFNYIEDDCLNLWIDLSDAVQRSINDEERLKRSFGKLVLLDDDNDILKVDVGINSFIALMLLLKALYVEVKKYEDDNFSLQLKDIEECFNLNGELRFVSDDDKFINFLKTGEVDNDDNSGYADCYRFYQNIIKQHAKVNKFFNGLMIGEILYEFGFDVKVI